MMRFAQTSSLDLTRRELRLIVPVIEDYLDLENTLGAAKL